ncbi:MAG: T9SS type A sorting domain-containing protein, partial [Bacteroidia bacterium]|nr:T9SS type A sorting domain-containing protein [Bacteroidia bacterium]
SFTGPGVVGSTFNPSLAGIGTHTLTATMVSNGCTSTATRLITVNRSPEASFNISTPGYTAQLNNTSLYADSYLWDFGDSTTSTATNPTHTYAGNGFYTIKLIATNVLCGTDTFSVNVDISVGIGNVEGVDQLQVFPNPTEGLLNLSFQSAEAQTFDIRILDAAGRLVATESFSTMPGKVNRQYDLSDKAKGIYFFSIRSEKGMMNYRIVKD